MLARLTRFINPIQQDFTTAVKFSQDQTEKQNWFSLAVKLICIILNKANFNYPGTSRPG